MRIEERQWGDVTLLTFTGDFDAFSLSTVTSAVDGLIEQGYLLLVFNLRLMTFINSSALGYLVKTKKEVKGQGGDVVIVQPSRFVKKALTVLGLHELFRIFESDEEAVLSFHRGETVRTVKLGGRDAPPDEKLLGANAIMFRLLDDKGRDLLGPAPFVGKIASAHKHGLLFRWQIPDAGGSSKLTADNVDEYLHPGRELSVKFRQPFVAKTKYFEALGTVMRVEKEMDLGDDREAMVHFEYTKIDAADKEALDRFVDDIEEFRKEVRK